MRLPWDCILSSVLCSAATASSVKAGRVYTWDSTTIPTTSDIPPLNPETARLVLAQRLGISQYHSIRKSSNGLELNINRYGGRPQQLFGKERERNNAHALIWIEGVENFDDIISDSKEYASFTLSNTPSTSENDRLVEDIIAQAESLTKKADPQSKTYNSLLKAGDLLDSIHETTVHNDYLILLRTSKPNKNTASTLSTLLRQARTDSFAMTIVLMPPNSSTEKRSANVYGTYDVPRIETRREKTEALLSPAASEPSSSPENLSAHNVESLPIVGQANDRSPILGILPKYFESKIDCERQTNNCSGHGECYVPEGKGDKGGSYSYCKCKASVSKGSKGEKKTYWGGPACQKKDVSVPFWLFVATGITLMSLIGGGITLLYSMGSEELPSVIGAGVSGPTRK